MNKKRLFRYIQGDCTDEEKISVTRWIDSSPENMKEYLSLRKLYDISIWQIPSQGNPKNKTKQIISSRSLKNLSLEIIKIAAVLIFGLFLSRYILPLKKTVKSVTEQTLYVPAGQRAQITLEDGTKVWLNAKTTLIFPNQFADKSREVKLDGEGFFEVTTNKSRPFIVKTRDYDIRARGTKFNILAYADEKNFETSLLEGSVEVMSKNNPNGILLQPDEQLILKNDTLSVTPIIHSNYFLWKEGIISFEDESFMELTEKLERYFDMNIIVKNEKLLEYRCTGKFRTKDGVEHILRVLQLDNQFTYVVNDKLNTIIIN